VCELNWDMGPSAPWHGAVFVAKWDYDGNLQWGETLPDPDVYNHPVGASIDSAGNLCVTGSRWPPGAGGFDWFVMKIEPDGDLIKTVTGGPGSIAYYTVSEDVDGALVLSGCHGWQDARMTKLDWSTETFDWDRYTVISPATATRGRIVPGALDPGNRFFVGKNVEVESSLDILGMTLQASSFWFIEYGSPDYIHRARCSDGVVTLTLPSPSANPHDLAWDGSSLWCGDWSGMLYELNPLTGDVLSSFDTELTNMRALHWDGTQFWAVSEDYKIHTIDIGGGTVAYMFDCPENNAATGICVHDGALWVSQTYSDIISRLDPTTGEWLGEFPPPGNQPTGIEFDGSGHLWITDSFSKQVYETSMSYGNGYWGRLDIVEVFAPLGANDVEDSVVACVRATDGGSIDAVSFNTATQEQPMAMSIGPSGVVNAAVWHPEAPTLAIVQFGVNEGDLVLQWGEMIAFSSPSVSPTGIATDADGLIYIVGHVGSAHGWDDSSEDSHIVTLVCDNTGEEIWRDIYDAGGPDEFEWATGGGVALAPDGRLYAGGTLSYSGTSWMRTATVIAYPRTVVDTASVFRVDTGGTVFSDGQVTAASFATQAADVAEWVCVTAPVEPGDVLAHSPENPGCYCRSTKPLSPLVSGVVSTEPGVVLGDGSVYVDRALLALTGIVPVKVTNEGGPITVGDLLVSSSTPGYAMRWACTDSFPDALVGKALEPMAGEFGVILVLLTAH